MTSIEGVPFDEEEEHTFDYAIEYPCLPEGMVLVSESDGIAWIYEVMKVVQSRSALFIPRPYEVVYDPAKEFDLDEVKRETQRIINSFTLIREGTKERILKILDLSSGRIFGFKTNAALTKLLQGMRALEKSVEDWRCILQEKMDRGTYMPFLPHNARCLQAQVTELSIMPKSFETVSGRVGGVLHDGHSQHPEAGVQHGRS